MDWTAKHFAAHDYSLDGSVLDDDATDLRLVLIMNGSTVINLSSRVHEYEPGLLAFYSRPAESGLRVIKVLPARSGALADHVGEVQEPPAWALEALGLPRE